MKTKIDNEKKYDLFEGVPYVGEMTRVALTGEEIKNIFTQTNKEICNQPNQACIFIGSNCCSAAIYILASIVKVLNNRNTQSTDSKKIIDDNIVDVCSLLIKVLATNFGEGVLDNGAIIQKIEEALHIARSRGLIEDQDPALTQTVTPKRLGR